LEIEPGRPSEQRRLGQIHLACDRREEALNMLRRALAGFRLGKQWPEAADVAAEVERLDPDDHSVRQLHGEALVRAGQPEKAIQVFTGLGNLSQSEHDYLMAEVAWNAILELEPTHGLARSQLATILAAQGRVKDAVDLWLALADGHRRAGESQAERGVLMTLTAAQPHNAPAQRRLAALWLEAGESDSAWQAYRHLLLAAQEAGDPEAWAALEQEILAASDDFRIRIALAGLHIESGRPGPALRLFLEVAEAHRKNGNTQAVLATCQTILGHDPENLGALEMLNEVLPEAGDQSSISLRQVRSTLARVYTREGDSKKALGLLEAVAAECPEDPQTLEGLARIHSERGNREEFEKAIQRCADAIKKSAQAAAVTHFVQLCSELSGNCPNPDLVRDVMAQVILAARHEASHRDTLLEIAAAWGEGSEEGGTRLRAAELYESLIAALPTDADLRRRFVDFLVQQGQHTRAVNELLGLSEILTRSHRDRDVVKTLEQARAIDPENSSVLLQLGRALLAQNARGRALEILKHAATIARTKETSAQLSELLNQILELDPGDLDARREMVEALKREGRKEDAIDHQLLLADQCASRGFLDLAAQHYRAVIQARPTDLETWTRLIDTHLDFGAEEDLLPDYLTVARLCQGEGKWQEAVRWYQGYLRLEPKKIEVRQEFLEALEHVAKPDEMKREFAKMAEHCRDAGRETQWQMWDKRSKAIGAKPAPPRSGLRSPSFSARASQPTRLPERPTSRPPAPPEDSAPPRRGGGPPRGSVTAAGASRRRVDEPKAPRTPAGSPTSGVGEKGEDLRRLLSQYLSHLNSNPKNPKLHSQVAELYNHLGDLETAFSHWCEASELFFEQRMWSNCQGICEKLLKLSPNDSQIRRRLEAVRSRQPSSGGFTTEGPDTLF